MSEPATATSEISLTTLELLVYDDGDVTIQSLNADFFDPGFVLDPSQQNRLVRRLPLLQGMTKAATWSLGENCASDQLFAAYDPNADPPYRLGDGDEWLPVTESELTDLIEQLTAILE